MKSVWVSFSNNLLCNEVSGIVRPVLRNCLRLDGTFSWDRTLSEIRSLNRTLCVLTLIITFYLLSNAALIWLLHSYVAPIPFVFKIFSAFHIEEEAWEDNIEQELGGMSEMARRYEKWAKSKGYSQPTSQLMEKALWHGWMVYVAVGAYFSVAFYFFIIRLSLRTIKIYLNHVRLRFKIHYDRDLLEIPRDKIIY